MKVRRINSRLLAISVILIATAISPAFAIDDRNRNLLLISIMFISPIIVLIYPRVSQNDAWLIFFMICSIIIPWWHQPDHLRWSTVMYSCLFCLTFMAYDRLLSTKTFTIDNYIKVIRYIIYAYFIVLFIQQFCVLSGLPIFNMSSYDPYNRWKLNSLAAEPSHSARIVGLLMFCYITAKEIFLRRSYSFKINFLDDMFLWVAFIWTMVTMGSTTAFVLIPLVLLKFIRFRNLIPLIIILFCLYCLMNIFGFVSFERAYKVFLATLSLDEYNIIQADQSAAMRIVPPIICFKMINLSTMNGWFGHGIDFVSTFLYLIIPGLNYGASGGGLFSVAIEYGFFVFSIFFVFSFIITFSRENLLSIGFWLLLIVINGINSQITWLSILLLFTNKYFQKLNYKS